MRNSAHEKTFRCSICDQRLSQIDILKRHGTNCTGEEPFACSVCDKSFSHLSHLKSHERIRTGENLSHIFQIFQSEAPREDPQWRSILGKAFRFFCLWLEFLSPLPSKEPRKNPYQGKAFPMGFAEDSRFIGQSYGARRIPERHLHAEVTGLSLRGDGASRAMSLTANASRDRYLA
ncbi:unnamed protein product, partial [Cyprideis torosa]